MNLEEHLYSHFGYSEFKGRQHEVISSVLKGQDTLAVLPTGSGKSLCYLLPSKILPGLTVVISPLISLMEDQVMQLKASGFKKTAHLSGFLDYNQKIEIIKRIEQLDVLFLSPEMLQQNILQEKLLSTTISLFAVDEAHCISQWGHEFRTDYLKLGEFIKRFKNPVTLALTATAPKKVRMDIIKQLGLNDPEILLSSVDRKRIFLDEYQVETEEDKRKYLFSIIETIADPVIIYCGTRKETEEIRSILKENQFQAEAYHGGMIKEDRMLIQQQFYYDQIKIVCATNAFGMGINKSNIRHVIHYHIPSSIEQYIQEIGRAGREGQKSTAHLIWKKEDLHLPLWMVESEFPDVAVIDNLEKLLVNNPLGYLDLKTLDVSEKQTKMIQYHLQNAKIINGSNLIKNVNKTDVINEISKMKNHFEQRSIDKKKQVAAMGKLLMDDGCIRKRIKEYFQEDHSEPPDECCSRCGQYPNLTINTAISSTKKTSHTNNWQSLLQRKLFGTEVIDEKTN